MTVESGVPEDQLLIGSTQDGEPADVFPIHVSSDPGDMLPLEADGGDMPVDEITGDGFTDVVSSDYADSGDGSSDSADDSSADYAGYYGDGSGDVGGDSGTDASYDGNYGGGWTVVSLGDVNGDGFEDFQVDGYGSSYVQYGYDASAYSGGGAEYDNYDYHYYGTSYSRSSAGDINGDGFEDFIVEGDGYTWTVYGYDSAAVYAGDGTVGDHVALGDRDGDGRGDVIYTMSATGGSDGPVFRDNASANEEDVPADDEVLDGGGDPVYGDGDGVVTVDGELMYATGGAGDAPVPEFSAEDMHISYFRWVRLVGAPVPESPSE